jgi:succinate dehydrogenase hydrophobic anchor subunit
MRRIFKEHGLSIVMFGLFLAFLFGHSVTGLRQYNTDQQDHRERPVGYLDYLTSANFIESVFENWESEFLQMGSYVLFTVFLFQKGSAESKDAEKEEPQDADPRQAEKRGAPWPVRRGGLVLAIYENSLTIAMFALFIASFLLHAWGGVKEFNQEQLEHGGRAISYSSYLTTSRMWFESFQNWQSEFLAVGTLVVLTIFLRQRGSPESKPVATSTWKTES